MKKFWTVHVILLLAAAYGLWSLLNYFGHQPVPTDPVAYHQYRVNLDTAAQIFGIFVLGLIGLAAYGATTFITRFFFKSRVS